MILFLRFLLASHVAGAAANVSKSLAPFLAADGLCHEQGCGTELVQLRAGRHQPPVHFEGSDDHFDPSRAFVDTVKGQPLPILDDDKVVVQSAIPVFTSNTAYIAFLFANNRQAGQQEFWNKTKDVKHFCRTKDGSHEAIMEKFGGELSQPYEWEVVWKCAWPMDRNTSYCHDAVVVEAASPQDTRVVGTVQACDRRMAHVGGDFPYKIAACVRPVFENTNSLQNSGIIKMPQWLEYNVMHGVDHFLIYTLKSKPLEGNITLKIAEPYFKAGLASHIEIDMPSENRSRSNLNKIIQVVIENDCLYRYKGRSQWVIPSVDVDEYLHLEGQTEGTSFTEILPSPNSYHAVNIPRYLSVGVSDPMTMLDIESTQREEYKSKSCPKYFASTITANVCFIHWTTSWVPGTTNLTLAIDHAHFNHYRFNASGENTWMIKFSWSNLTSEAYLPTEVSTLQKRLQVRYGMPWTELEAQLHRRPMPSSPTF